jgi:hypothetical protein
MTWRRVALYYLLFGVALAYYVASERRPAPEAPAPGIALVSIPLGRLGDVLLIRDKERVRCRQESGRWRVVEPSDALAPADLISTFVITLVETHAAELIGERGKDGTAFGLGEDAIRVELYERGHDRPVTVLLGARNPTETAIYATVEGSSRVLLVGRVLQYYVGRIFEEVHRRPQTEAPPILGLLDVLFKYACVALRSEGPEATALSTLSRRQPMNNPG